MSKKKEAEKVPEQQMTFLVVDDDSGARQTLVEYLKSFGYNSFVQAKNGNEAVEALKKHKIDFVISDWEMPSPNGLELLRILRSDERFNKIPFVMVTSPISEEKLKVEDAATSSVDAYIIKPFRAEVLREKVDRILSERAFDQRKGALVVDDDDFVRETMIDYLKCMGYDPIYQAQNGEEGFTVLKAHVDEIAFVVSDWEMPKLAGIELLKKIRNDKALEAVPFIMVTSQTSIERIKIKQAMSAYVDHYLLKPFRVEDLKAKVDQILQSAKAQLQVDLDLKRGAELLDKGLWADSIKIFNRVVLLDPTSVRAYLGLATAQRHIAPEKAIPKATQYIRKAIDINPAFVEAHIDLALTFESAMSIDKAIACLKEGLKTCSFSELIHYHLGRLLARRGLQSEAIRELKQALEIAPEFKEAQELLSGLRGKTDE